MGKNFVKQILVQNLHLVEHVDVVLDDGDDEACLDGQETHKVQDKSHFIAAAMLELALHWLVWIAKTCLH